MQRCVHRKEKNNKRKYLNTQHNITENKSMLTLLSSLAIFVMMFTHKHIKLYSLNEKKKAHI